MIVLDEQLLGYDLQDSIWYRGTVTDITQLRPGTVIADDAIPAILRGVRQPTFVTINVKDFWRRLSPDPRFCMACCAVPDSRTEEIPELLRRLFATHPFRTRSRRLGKIARVSRHLAQFYTTRSWSIRAIPM